MCCRRLAGNTGCKNDAKNRYLHTIAQLCWAVSLQLKHLSTIGKNLLNGNMSSTCPHNMANFGPLTAEIGLPVWGTPANFNGFRVLASLLHRRRSTEVSQTLHDAWCKIHFAPKSCVLLYWQHYCTALEQWASAKLRRGTRNKISELSLLVCATYIPQDGHHVGHRPTFWFI